MRVARQLRTASLAGQIRALRCAFQPGVRCPTRWSTRRHPGFSTNDFAITRTGETGSWLAKRFHGQGIGTRMRRAMCAFVFDELDATEITSGAFLDNQASLAVSRKVGYRPNGTEHLVRRGDLAGLQRLVLTPGDFIRGDEMITVTGAESLRVFLGLTVR
ncbi:GNAT family N-acetyltransferase [Microlunatus endophyticus]